MAELTRTSTGLLNNPNEEQARNLVRLVENVLDPLRYLYGKPIIVNSGFRNPEVNRAVGGVGTSAHTRGQAADISCFDNRKLFSILFHNFNYTQLIWERGDDKQPDWVHVSYDPENLKNETLRYDGEKYTKYESK